MESEQHVHVKLLSSLQHHLRRIWNGGLAGVQHSDPAVRNCTDSEVVSTGQLPDEDTQPDKHDHSNVESATKSADNVPMQDRTAFPASARVQLEVWRR